jgi:hypothetical protein
VDEPSDDEPEVRGETTPGTAEVAGADEVAAAGGVVELAGGAVAPGTAEEAGSADDAGVADEAAEPPGAVVEAASSCAWAGRGAAAAVAAQTSRTVAKRRRIPGEA